MFELSIERPEVLVKVSRALSTKLRLDILQAIEDQPISVTQLSKQLNCSLSTMASNVKILEEAGLIRTQLKPAKNGSMKLCSPVYRDIRMHLHKKATDKQEVRSVIVNMPIGHYSQCQITPSCGMFSTNSYIGKEDDVSVFYNPNRVDAHILWFSQGFIEYRFPNSIQHKTIKALELSLEICSEAPGYSMNHPSDISMWINGIDLGVWTSPGDFGDRRGHYTPDQWPLGNTQYGLLKSWYIDAKGTSVSGEKISNININDLKLNESPFISIQIGIKDDANNIGGLNLFGKKFGDHDQDIQLTLYC